MNSYFLIQQHFALLSHNCFSSWFLQNSGDAFYDELIFGGYPAIDANCRQFSRISIYLGTVSSEPEWTRKAGSTGSTRNQAAIGSKSQTTRAFARSKSNSTGSPSG